MEKGTWRNLILAAFAGVAAYVACAVWGPWPMPRKTLSDISLTPDIQRLELSPDASLISASFGKPIPRRSVWTIFEKTQVFRINDSKVLIEDKRNCVFAPKGDVFALHDMNQVQVFTASSDNVIAGSKWDAPVTYLVSVSFDEKGRLFYCGYWAHNYCESAPLDGSKGELQFEFERYADVFHLSGKWVFTPTYEKEGECIAYDITTGQRVCKFDAASDFRHYVLSGNGNSLVIYPVDRFNSPNGNPTVHNLKTRAVRNLAFEGKAAWLSPDGKLAACTSFIVVEAPWLQKLKSLLGIPIVAGGPHRGVTLADMETGQELAFFKDARLPCFSADGKTLALLNQDGHIELWDLPLKSAVPPMVLIATVVTLLIFLLVRRNYRRRFRPEARHDRSQGL